MRRVQQLVELVAPERDVPRLDKSRGDDVHEQSPVARAKLALVFRVVPITLLTLTLTLALALALTSPSPPPSPSPRWPSRAAR